MSTQKVIGYIRVSTDKQVDEGVSLEAQEEKIRTYCELYNLELVGIEVDAGKSAKSLTGREGLQRALAALASGECSALVVTKIDRLSRSIMDMGVLVRDHFKEGQGLISIAEQIDTGTAAGRMLLHMITVFSQYERELIGERTRDALGHLKASGVKLGAPALGWRVSDAPEGISMDPAEQRVIQRIHELEGQGWTLRKIAAQLTEDGHPTKRGGKWHPQTVRLVLQRA